MNSKTYTYHWTNLAKTCAVIAYLRELGYGVEGTKKQQDIKRVALEQMEQYEWLNIYRDSMSTGGNSHQPNLTELSFDELFETDLSQWRQHQCELSKDCTATINDDGSVSIGHQTFSSDVILELAKEVQKTLDNK